mmetsp:Transcript_36749/g.110940  ORF Transcript_36749/g.110940 Transcript_36749/m.110940 type:complete len:327 (+) Transcript_36749:123-1103(+)
MYLRRPGNQPARQDAPILAPACGWRSGAPRAPRAATAEVGVEASPTGERPAQCRCEGGSGSPASPAPAREPEDMALAASLSPGPWAASPTWTGSRSCHGSPSLMPLLCRVATASTPSELKLGRKEGTLLSWLDALLPRRGALSMTPLPRWLDGDSSLMVFATSVLWAQFAAAAMSEDLGWPLPLVGRLRLLVEPLECTLLEVELLRAVLATSLLASSAVLDRPVQASLNDERLMTRWFLAALTSSSALAWMRGVLCVWGRRRIERCRFISSCMEHASMSLASWPKGFSISTAMQLRDHRMETCTKLKMNAQTGRVTHWDMTKGTVK